MAITAKIRMSGEEVKAKTDFSYDLYEFACEKKLLDVENRSQELSGLAAKTIYRLTLS